MCILCTSFQNNELTVMEAWSNYAEMAETMDPEHADEVLLMLIMANEQVGFNNKMPKPTLKKIKGE